MSIGGLTSDSGVSRRVLGSSCLLLFLLGLGFRLWGIGLPGPQPDELHWERRSHALLEKLQSGDFVRATSHLAHPGIPAASAMALGQYIAEKSGDTLFGLSIDRLSSSRIAVSLLSCLVGPVLFLGIFPIFGFSTAFLASALFVLDPYYIGLSRIAHIDSTLTLFVSLTVFLYLRAIPKGSFAIKICAGIAWGLAIATKPTALVLAPAFFLANCVTSAFRKKRDKPEGPNSGLWGDVWLVITALSVFTLLYTRLWYPIGEGPYRENLARGREILGGLMWVVRSIGLFFLENPFLYYLVLSFCFLVVVWGLSQIWRESRSNWKMFVTTGAVVLGVVIVFPQALEGLLGFFGWTFGLVKEQHRSYGMVWEKTPYSYFGLTLSKLPTIVLLGLFAWILVTLRGVLLTETQGDRGRFRASVSLLFVIFVWGAVLSCSSKQAYRYFMPVVPFIYVLSAVGFLGFVRSRVLLPFAIAFSMLTAFSWSPNYSLFFNLPSGGLRGAESRKIPLAFSAQNQAISFLDQLAFREQSSLRVAVVGDPTTLRRAYQRLVRFRPEFGKQAIHFTGFNPAVQGHFVLIFESLARHLSRVRDFTKDKKPVFTHSFKGVNLLSIYEPLYPGFGHPIVYDVAKQPRRRGRLERCQAGAGQSSKKIVCVSPGRDASGYMFFGAQARLKPGDYKGTFFLGLPAMPEKLAVSPKRYAVRLEFGSKCQKIVSAGELSEAELRPFEVPCKVDKVWQTELRVYWFGNVPTSLSAVELHVEG